jgi:transcriptional regulator with XRE-family HTH domain
VTYAANFCKNLDTYMESESITSNSLATRSGISQKTIWVVKAAKTNPTVTTAEAISNALGLDARIMMGKDLSADQIGRSSRIGRLLDKMLSLDSDQLKSIQTIVESMNTKE